MFIIMVVWLLGQGKNYTHVKRLLLVDIGLCSKEVMKFGVGE